jgi:hypothetical protein
VFELRRRRRHNEREFVSTNEECIMFRAGIAGILALGFCSALAVAQPPSQAMPLPPPRNLEQIPGPQPSVVLEPLRPVEPREFVKSFVPVPGKYDVLFVHPVNGRPVSVLFQLPDGTPKRVRYVGHSLVFDYGRHQVDIRFQLGGKVTVAQR